MLRAILNITFTKLSGDSITFNFCNSIETDESYENLTDTAKIILPYKLSMKGLNVFAGTDPIFKRGDKVSISTGYYPNLVNIFNGYVKNISSNVPVEVECEDEMYILKQYTLNYPDKKGDLFLGLKEGFKIRPKVIKDNLTLRELLNNIIPDAVSLGEIADTEIGSFRISNSSPAMVLDKIKSDLGLYSYFKDGKLNVGFANNAASTNEATLEMEKQVINSEDLDYQIKEDIKIRVKAVSIMPDNSKIEVVVGDENGEQHSIHTSNLNKAALTKYAQKWADEAKYTGFKGDLETFGEPYLRHGDRVKIISKRYPEKNGTYLIKRVKRKLSADVGVRQIFTLGVKVA